MRAVVVRAVTRRATGNTPRIPAAIAESVELLDISDGERGLGLDPRAQPDLERAMRVRIEWTGGECRARLTGLALAGDQDPRRVAVDGEEGGGQPDLDRDERRRADHSRSSRNGIPSYAISPRPIASIAATMRPSRASIRSAIATMRALGVAVAEALRICCAIPISSRPGLSAQAATKAPAVERLMPA